LAGFVPVNRLAGGSFFHWPARAESSMNRYLKYLVPVLLAGSTLLQAIPVGAADADTAQQLEQLRAQVQALEARIRQLEQAAQAPGAAAKVAPGATPVAASNSTVVVALDPALQSLGRLKQNWKAVHNGMDAAQVRALLGEPAQEFPIDSKPVWQYVYPGLGTGSVMFSVDGAVIGAQNPPFSFW
jgi:predicted component of type VI protein secretion system